MTEKFSPLDEGFTIATFNGIAFILAIILFCFGIFGTTFLFLKLRKVPNESQEEIRSVNEKVYIGDHINKFVQVCFKKSSRCKKTTLRANCIN